MTEEQSKEARRLERVAEQEAKVRQLEVDYKVCQEETKAAREELSEAIALLRRIIRGEDEEQPGLDFGDDDENINEEPTDDEWERVLEETPLYSAIKLTKPQREKLENIGVESVKHFEQLRAGQYAAFDGDFYNLKGFSVAAREKIEEDLLDWCDRTQIALKAAKD